MVSALRVPSRTSGLLVPSMTAAAAGAARLAASNAATGRARISLFPMMVALPEGYRRPAFRAEALTSNADAPSATPAEAKGLRPGKGDAAARTGRRGCSGLRLLPERRLARNHPSTKLHAAVKDGRLVRNPAAGVALPRVESRPRRYFRHDQLHALAAACGPYQVLLTLGYCG